MNIDLYSILRDISKYIVVILLLAASMSLLAYVYVEEVITSNMNQPAHSLSAAKEVTTVYILI